MITIQSGFIDFMSTTNNAAVKRVLHMIFAMWGCLPTTIVSDNSSPFDSLPYFSFCTQFNILVRHSPPRHAPSNSYGEIAVGIAK